MAVVTQAMVHVSLVVREGLQGGTRVDLPFVFSEKEYMHSFWLSGFC